MNTRSLRKRLDRLTRANAASEQKKAQTPDFSVDPVLAKALRDGYERQLFLFRKSELPQTYGGPATAAEEEERIMLQARIPEIRKAIVCPPGYGPMEFRADRSRSRYFERRRNALPEHGGGPLTDAEDAEEAQVTARLAAYPHGADVRARGRIWALRNKNDHERSSAEQTELDSLVLLHPDVPPDPEEAWRNIFADSLVEADKVSEERHRKWMEERLVKQKNNQSSPGRSNKTEPLRSNKTDDRDEIEKLIVKLGGPGAGA